MYFSDIDVLTKCATEYRKDCQESLYRNRHMNDFVFKPDRPVVSQEIVDAILVDFINFVGMKNCGDVGLYTQDIQK